MLLVIVGVVALVYFGAPERHADRPVSKLPNGPPAALAIRGASPPVVYAGNLYGFLVSRNRAASWQVDQAAGEVSAIAASGAEPTRLFVAGASLWRDDGSGLAVIGSDLPGGAIRAMAVDLGDSRRVFAIGPHRTFLASVDAGAHWGALGSETPTDATSLTIGNGQSRFYLGTSEHGVFASADGQTWVNASGFVNGALPTHAVAAIVFDPASGDRYVGPTGESATGALYAGTDRGIFKSIDGGVSWNAMPLHQPIVALAVGPPGVKLMVAADPDGNVYRSTDGGSTWN